jgi:sterol desaturase/sphingolipid hydroxylase (fatty acid hydroxylase superfamily)
MKAFFEHTYLPPLSIISLFIIFFILEKIFPLRNSTQKLLPRLMVNFIMAVMTFIIATTLVRTVSLSVLSWNSEASFGLLHLLGDTPFFKFLLGFLLLDLSFYYWHRLNHRMPLLWRFHNAHHIDPDLDVSTAFRFHFGEVTYSTLFRAFQVFIIGPDLLLFLSYEFVFQIGTFFHHSNLRIPCKLERLLQLIFVTPRMHGIHHSQFKSETNSNYSVVLSFWDRIHRTFTRNVSQDDITIGVPGYSDAEDNHLRTVLQMPFRQQKVYWDGQISRPKR